MPLDYSAFELDNKKKSKLDYSAFDSKIQKQSEDKFGIDDEKARTIALESIRTKLESTLSLSKAKLEQLKSYSDKIPYFSLGKLTTSGKISNKEREIKNLEQTVSLYNDFLNNSNDRGIVSDFFKAFKDKSRAGIARNTLISGPMLKFSDKLEALVASNLKEKGYKISPLQESMIEKQKAMQIEQNNGAGYLVGNIISEAPEFMAEMFLGSELIGKPLLNKILPTFGKGKIVGVSKILQKVYGLSEKVGVNELMANVASKASIAGGVTLAHIPNIIAEKAIPYQEILQNKAFPELYDSLGGTDEFKSSVAKAIGMDFIDNATEFLGGIVEEPLNFFAKATLGKWISLKGIKASKLSKLFKTNIAWNGIVGEVFEEELSNLLQAPLQGQEYKPVWTPEGARRLMIETIGISALGGVGGLVNVSINEVDRYNKLTEEEKQRGSINLGAEVGGEDKTYYRGEGGEQRGIPVPDKTGKVSKVINILGDNVVYLTEDKKVASKYGKVSEYNVDLKNPLKLESESDLLSFMSKNKLESVFSPMIQLQGEEVIRKNIDAFKQAIEKEGYDGVIVKVTNNKGNLINKMFEDDQVIVFDKSAVSNKKDIVINNDEKQDAINKEYEISTSGYLTKESSTKLLDKVGRDNNSINREMGKVSARVETLISAMSSGDKTIQMDDVNELLREQAKLSALKDSYNYNLVETKKETKRKGPPPVTKMEDYSKEYSYLANRLEVSMPETNKKEIWAKRNAIGRLNYMSKKKEGRIRDRVSKFEKSLEGGDFKRTPNYFDTVKDYIPDEARYEYEKKFAIDRISKAGGEGKKLLYGRLKKDKNGGYKLSTDKKRYLKFNGLRDNGVRREVIEELVVNSNVPITEVVKIKKQTGENIDNENRVIIKKSVLEELKKDSKNNKQKSIERIKGDIAKINIEKNKKLKDKLFADSKKAFQKGKESVSNLIGGYITQVRVFRELGPAYTKYILEPMKEAEKEQILLERDIKNNKLKTFYSLSKEEVADLRLFAFKKQGILGEDGKELKAKTLEELTPNTRKAYFEIIKTGRGLFPLMKEVAMNNGVDLGHIVSYTPAYTRDDIDFSSNEDLTANQDTTRPFVKSMLERKVGTTIDIYETDYIKTIDAWIEGVSKYVTIGKASTMVKYLIRSKEFRKIAGKDKTDIIDSWFEFVVGRPKTGNVDKAVKTARMLQSFAILSFSVTVPLKQFLNIVNAHSILGAKTIFNATKQTIKNEGLSRYIKDSAVILQRGVGLSVSDIGQKSITFKNLVSLDFELKDLSESFLYWAKKPSEATDRFTARIIKLSVMQRLLSKEETITDEKFSEVELYADNVVEAIMGEMTRAGSPQYFRSEIGKAVNAFTSQVNSLSQFYIMDIFQEKFPELKKLEPSKKKLFTKAIITIIVVAYLEQAINKLSLFDKPEEVAKDTLSSIAGNVPLLGSLIFSIQAKQPYAPSPILTNFGRMLTNFYNGKTEDALWTGTTFFGLPQQLRKTIQGSILLGEGGSYTKTGKKRYSGSNTVLEAIRTLIKGKYGSLEAKNYYRKVRDEFNNRLKPNNKKNKDLRKLYR